MCCVKYSHTLLLGVTTFGPVCGVTWLSSKVEHDPSTGQLKLASPELLGDDKAAFGPELSAALKQRLEQKGALTIPFDLSAVPASLKELVERLAKDLPAELEARFTPKPPTVGAVTAHAEGLVAEVNVTADAKIVASK